MLNLLLPLHLFVYLRIGILSLYISAPLTVLLLLNPVLNLNFSLLPITSSHSYASASDSTFDYWRYVNILLTLIDIDSRANILPTLLPCNIYSIEKFDVFGRKNVSCCEITNSHRTTDETRGS